MLKKLLNKIGAVIGCVLFIFFLGFGIGSNETMPPYARVYVDDAAKTYLALPCREEWGQRQTSGAGELRLAVLRDVDRKIYSPDDACIQTGAFAPDGRSLSGRILESYGLLPSLTFWWDQPFRTEDGSVVDPRKS